MRRALAWLAAGLLLLLAASCDLSDEGDPERYLSILASDTLLAYDTVLVISLAPGTDSALDTLWNAPLRSMGQLSKLKAEHYRGGAVDVLILGVKDGWAGYSLKVEYRGTSEPNLISSPPWDTLPPRLDLKGPDSAGLREGEALPDTGARCEDAHPGMCRLEVSGKVDRFRAGAYALEYACRDRAGNMARRVQRIVVSRWPDTLAPELLHPGDAFRAMAPGFSLGDGGVSCRDDRDSGLAPIREGDFDTDTPGEYHLAYHCADASGNRSPEWILRVRVLPWPDHVPPQITLIGPDSMLVYEGSGFDDPGAKCHDGQEDRLHYTDPDSLPMKREGELDLTRRGIYTLKYSCEDAAGNIASIGRRVVVARVPDPVPPVLALRGPDTVDTYDHVPYIDSGASCSDARDGILPVKVEGAVDVGIRGRYELRFRCEDSVGNAAEAKRVVLVVRSPDSDGPALTLNGGDSAEIYDRETYSDPGATCRDARDGDLPVSLYGRVDGAARGRYVLAYRCADSAGNAAEAQRVVRVVRRPDAVPPALILTGPDSLDIYDRVPYADAGAKCRDERDGDLPVAVEGAVDPGVRGRYELRFACADSAGNAAAAKRVVRVVRFPDAVPPVLILKGPDTLAAYENQPFADPGASCLDDRDGELPVSASGTVDTGRRGSYPIAYGCTDSAGNGAGRSRLVRVIRVPDPVKPVVTLIGPAAVSIWKGDGYSDSGATCLDDRDGNLPVSRLGTVDAERAGSYTLKFACADSAGNLADTVARTVTVAMPPDVGKPVVTLLGADTIPVMSLSQFDDPGAACADDRDGGLTAVFAGFDPPSGPVDAVYRARYTCTDRAGNVGEAFRVVKSGLYTASLPVTQDASIDTIDTWYNNGNTFVSAVCAASGGKYAALFKFDLSKVGKTGLKSAKVRFPAWGRGEAWKWPAGARDYTIQLWAVRRAWTEGTGNWFYHRNGWQNGGQEWLADYAVSDSVKAASSDPALGDGITGADKDILRPGNVSLMGSGKVNVHLAAAPYRVPPPQDLRVIEIDVTDYVKRTDAAQDFGFYIVSPDEPDFIGILDRDVEDGKYAMRLMLSY